MRLCAVRVQRRWHYVIAASTGDAVMMCLDNFGQLPEIACTYEDKKRHWEDE